MRQIYPVTLTPEAELPGHALGKEEGWCSLGYCLLSPGAALPQASGRQPECRPGTSVPNKQGTFRVDAAAGQRRKEREKQCKNERAEGQQAEQGKADTELGGGREWGGGSREGGREKESGGGRREWTPRKCEVHAGKGRRWITSEELHSSKTNSNQEARVFLFPPNLWQDTGLGSQALYNNFHHLDLLTLPCIPRKYKG